MIREINYKGFFIPESSIPGEQSCDGMTPNYAHGQQVSKDRWLIMYDTVDVRGRDCWRSIFYQIRKDAPDGEVITEKPLTVPEPAGELPDGNAILKIAGQPIPFGVPKGALVGGKVPAHANLFCITMTTCLTQRWPNGDLARYRSEHEEDTSFGSHAMQVRLNDTDDDLEIVSPLTRLVQVGDSARHVYGWTHPSADNPQCTEWLDAMTIAGGRSSMAVRWRFNAESRLYEWIDSGEPFSFGPEAIGGENSFVKLGEGDYVIAVRGFNRGGRTYWFRTSDAMKGVGGAVEVPGTYGQRYAFRCADGVMRIFLNNRELSPYADRRNPLDCFDVNPNGFTYANRRIVFDAREQGLPFETPFVDHVHLYEPIGDRQIMSIRTIDAAQVWRPDEGESPSDDEMAQAGIRYVDIVYDEPASPTWRFT